MRTYSCTLWRLYWPLEALTASPAVLSLWFNNLLILDFGTIVAYLWEYQATFWQVIRVTFWNVQVGVNTAVWHLKWWPSLCDRTVHEVFLTSSPSVEHQNLYCSSLSHLPRSLLLPRTDSSNRHSVSRSSTLKSRWRVSDVVSCLSEAQLFYLPCCPSSSVLVLLSSTWS